MILGGAVGNLIDRVFVGFLSFILFVVLLIYDFNFVDSAIVVGVVLLRGGAYATEGESAPTPRESNPG